MIVSLDRYRAVTIDTTTADVIVTGALTDAQRLIEEHLHRPLERAETTERLPIYRFEGRARVHPRRIPVVSAPASASYAVEDTASIIDVSPLAWPNQPTGVVDTADVTFTGGWLASDDPAPTDGYLIPVELERAIIDLAVGLVASRPAAAGVTQASVGDVSVTYAEPSGGIDGYTPGLTTRLAPYRYRPYT